MKKRFPRLALVIILIFLVASRFLGNNYDNLTHLHPDERWLVMVAGKLHFFDRLDPDFFAYGSLPIYTLKALAQSSDALLHTEFDSYDGLLVLGRGLSSVIDILIAIIVYQLAKKVGKNKSVGIFALISYTLFFFPIQNSNFFIVDPFVSLFLSATILAIIQYLKSPKPKWAVVTALCYGLLLACKITPIIFLPLLVGYIFLIPLLRTNLSDKIQSALRSDIHRILVATGIKKSTRSSLQPKPIAMAVLLSACFLLATNIFAFLGSPYTILHYKQFLTEISAQLKMNSDAYIFPYTLQYVDTTPYIYYLKQIFLWGIGPLLSLSVVGGIIITMKQIVGLLKKKKFGRLIQEPYFLLTLFSIFYFLVLGRSAVKFMRYLLPLYPMLAVFSGVFLSNLWQDIDKKYNLKKIIVLVILTLATAWTGSFLSIYTRPHTRITATNWILQHIPAGSTLAEEHWDDRLPLTAAGSYNYAELPLYELPDDATKWRLVNSRLASADYIVLTSNRLFGSLPKLADCSSHIKCYPLTTSYYEDLFANRLGFKKVAEFTSRPSMFGFEIIDDNADESFTVYDHPRVIIFQKQP